MSELRWEKDLQFSTLGAIKPTKDPFEEAFYISDGWGTPFASLSLRKISIHDGKELASIRLRQPVRCMFFFPDGREFLVATDKRLFLLNRETLTVVNKWDKTGCIYPSYILADNEKAYLMNYRGQMLTVFHFESGEITRKKVGSCGGLFFDCASNILVFSNKDGKLSKYCTKNNELKKELDTHLHVECEYSQGLDMSALSLGDPYEIKKEKGIIRIYDMRSSYRFNDFKIPFIFEHFRMSNDYKMVYLSYKDNLAIFSVDQKKVVFKDKIGGRLSNWSIVEIFPEERLCAGVINKDMRTKIGMFSFLLY